MRKLGVGVLGLFAGLLIGFVITELIARPLLAAGADVSAVPIALLLGLLPPALAGVGVAVALRIDRVMRA
ncbi:MAG: hypothetical protein ACRD0H_04175 [Actinomycetes bacterium]